MAKKGGLLSDPGIQFLIALGAATVAGLAAKALYNRCTKTEKKEWRQALPHHGEVGIPIVVGGVLSGNPAVTGTGLGLVLSDLDDKDKWFRRTH